MRLSIQWLRDWIPWNDDVSKLIEKLALGGIETEKIYSPRFIFDKVLAGEITEIKPIKEDNYLYKIRIHSKVERQFEFVESYGNLPKGTKIAIALKDTSVYNTGVANIENNEIKGAVKICTEKLLGYSENEEFIILPPSTSLGEDVSALLQINDHILDLEITPNRSDCLSIKGLAQELSALTELPLKNPIEEKKIKLIGTSTAFPVAILDQAACPNYCMRIIKEIDNTAYTPLWIQERLRKAGIKILNPIVDILNYVMVELGQPMHAYDLEKIEGVLQVRYAKTGETLELLDNKLVTLDETVLIIADDKGPIGIAGIMGGKRTSVESHTRHVLLESAFFNSDNIRGRARQLGIATESSYRFERGVSTNLQIEALERAGMLAEEIVGGNIEEITKMTNLNLLPTPKVISFRPERAIKLLGMDVSQERMQQIFEKLGFKLLKQEKIWEIRAPAHRLDIGIEADLIEEIARIEGYDKIPYSYPFIELKPSKINNIVNIRAMLADCLRSSGYQECITYSFVEPKLQQLLFSNVSALRLLNPISPELSEMRVSLWPGLIRALQYNMHRQQERIRLFEIGVCYDSENPMKQISRLGGIASGQLLHEQWGSDRRKVDFFDVKCDLESILIPFSGGTPVSFQKAEHSALHPGQSAQIYFGHNPVGWIGSIHPNHLIALDLKSPIILFEVELDSWFKLVTPVYQPISPYPTVRRDISFFIDREIIAQNLIDEIKKIPCTFLQDVSIFDVYSDNNRSAKKSIAMGLTLQHLSRTLIEEEINAYIEQVVQVLKHTFNIQLRDK